MKRSVGGSFLQDLRGDVLKASNPQAAFNMIQTCTPRSGDLAVCAHWVKDMRWEPCPGGNPMAVSAMAETNRLGRRRSTATVECSCPFDAVGQVLHAVFILRDETRACQVTEVSGNMFTKVLRARAERLYSHAHYTAVQSNLDLRTFDLCTFFYLFFTYNSKYVLKFHIPIYVLHLTYSNSIYVQ